MAQEHDCEKLREFIGKKLARIKAIGKGSICIEFEDGSELSIELDGGDIRDAWISVNGVPIQDL